MGGKDKPTRHPLVNVACGCVAVACRQDDHHAVGQTPVTDNLQQRHTLFRQCCTSHVAQLADSANRRANLSSTSGSRARDMPSRGW